MINAVGLQNPGIAAWLEELPLLAGIAVPRRRQHRRQPAARTTSRSCAASRNVSRRVAPPCRGSSATSSTSRVRTWGAEASRSAPSRPRPSGSPPPRAPSPRRLVIVKLTPNVTDIVAVARAAADAGADAVSLVNTLRALVLDPQSSRRSWATAPAASAGRPSSRSPCAWCGRWPPLSRCRSSAWAAS